MGEFLQVVSSYLQGIRRVLVEVVVVEKSSECHSFGGDGYGIIHPQFVLCTNFEQDDWSMVTLPSSSFDHGLWGTPCFLFL